MSGLHGGRHCRLPRGRIARRRFPGIGGGVVSGGSASASASTAVGADETGEGDPHRGGQGVADKAAAIGCRGIHNRVGNDLRHEH